MKNLFTVLVLLVSTVCVGQSYLRKDEQLIFSFQTSTSKQVYLVKEKTNKYISYRFGTKDKIEFEFPGTEKDSWGLFQYSFFLRGGGTANEGIDLNYVYFTNKGFQYVIYDTYTSVGNKTNIGVKVTDLKTNKTVDIKGSTKSRKGTLVDFRENKLLTIGDELFD